MIGLASSSHAITSIGSELTAAASQSPKILSSVDQSSVQIGHSSAVATSTLSSLTASRLLTTIPPSSSVATVGTTYGDGSGSHTASTVLQSNGLSASGTEAAINPTTASVTASEHTVSTSVGTESSPSAIPLDSTNKGSTSTMPGGHPASSGDIRGSHFSSAGAASGSTPLSAATKRPLPW